MKRRRVICGVVFLAVAALLAQPPARKGTTTHAAGLAAAQAEKPKFKAIWEPVNVKEDLKLFAVHFVSADEGWVAGGRDELHGGMILHTTDGGNTWEPQLGDPQSSDRAYNHLSFLSPQVGWATQSTQSGEHNLLRTNDGKTWSEAGKVAQNRTDYHFTSQDVGFVASRNNILRTQDGGRTWRPVYHCAVKVEIDGLTRDAACEFEKIDFPDATTGYALSRRLGSAGSVLAKTTDGGETWTPSVILPGEDAKESGLRFTDPNTGVLRTIDGKLFYTGDGGKTWIGATGKADGRPAIEFATKDVGWMIVYRTMTYTVDGGKHWTSREINFPATVWASSLVQRDRGYAVGEHGMVYRYRVVPLDYTSKGMLPAPML